MHQQSPLVGFFAGPDVCTYKIADKNRPLELTGKSVDPNRSQIPAGLMYDVGVHGSIHDVRERRNLNRMKSVKRSECVELKTSFLGEATSTSWREP